MNEANHCIISAILKSEHRNNIQNNHNYPKADTQYRIEQFISSMFGYDDMDNDAKEAFDYMFNECIDLGFIERKLQDIKNEENDY